MHNVISRVYLFRNVYRFLYESVMCKYAKLSPLAYKLQITQLYFEWMQMQSSNTFIWLGKYAQLQSKRNRAERILNDTFALSERILS